MQQVQNLRGFDDIHKEMNRLAHQFRKIVKTIDHDGNVTGEVVYWTSISAETRYNELQKRCVEIEQATSKT